jgi:hypothetical protein
VAWRAELANIDPRRLIFLDESGIDTRMTRAYARAAPGARAVGKVPWGQWERLTVIGALGLEGVLAGMSIAAATTGPLLALRSSPGLRRAGADPGAAGPAGRHRGDGQSRRPQGRAGP